MKMSIDRVMFILALVLAATILSGCVGLEIVSLGCSIIQEQPCQVSLRD